jgi:hypothetical protein
MPKGVLWREHNIFVAAMGGRPFGSDSPVGSYAELADHARQAAGSISLLMLPPFIHGAAYWAASEIMPASATTITSVSRWAALKGVDHRQQRGGLSVVASNA